MTLSKGSSNQIMPIWASMEIFTSTT